MSATSVWDAPSGECLRGIEAGTV